MKTDLYTFVHKAQRRLLFDLSADIARADFSDPAEAQAIAARLRGLLAHLREHAAIEERYIHPLYRALASDAARAACEEALPAVVHGDACAGFDADHADLEREIASLEALLGEERWGKLHRAYNGFLGRYLVHLEEEEAAQEAILWTRYDAELAEVFARFQRERAPEKAREDLEFFLPALSAPELTGMFLGMKARAPAPVFEFASGLAGRMVEPERWAKVRAALG